MNLAEIAVVVHRQWRKIAVNAIGCFAVFYVLGQFMVRYEAHATALVRPIGEVSDIGNPSVGFIHSSEIGVLDLRGESYAQLLRSRSLITDVVGELGCVQRPSASGSVQQTVIEWIKYPLRLVVFGRTPTAQTPLERAVDKAAKDVTASFIGKSSLIEINARNDDPQCAADLANGLLGAFMTHIASRSHHAIQAVRELVDAELATCQQTLHDRQTRMQQLAKAAGFPVFVDLDKEWLRIDKKLDTIEREIDQRRFKQPLIAKRLQRIDEQLKELPEYERVSYIIKRNSRINSLKDQLLQGHIDKQRALLDFDRTSLSIKSFDERIDLVKKSLGREVKTFLDQETHHISTRYQKLLEERLALETESESNIAWDQGAVLRAKKYEEQLLDLEEVETDLRSLNSDVKQLKEYESTLLKKQTHLAAIAEVGFQEIEIIDHAIAPRYPSLRSAPLIFFGLLGLVLGGIGTTGYCVWRDEIGQTRA